MECEQTMSDHAEIVRDTLRTNGVMRYGHYERSNTLPALREEAP